MEDEYQAPQFLPLREALSEERLAPYTREGQRHDLHDLSGYAWNVSLCRALYPALHFAEVALRNRIHNAASRWIGVNWLTGSTLSERDQAKVKEALDSLKERESNPTPGQLVAELNFGFWVALFHSRYETALWPRFLPIVFPGIPASLRTRKNIYATLEQVRSLRNRVFHHEPIWYWSDLEEKHRRLWDLISWLCPILLDLVAYIDDFPEVYRAGPVPFRELLQEFLRTGESNDATKT